MTSLHCGSVFKTVFKSYDKKTIQNLFLYFSKFPLKLYPQISQGRQCAPSAQPSLARSGYATGNNVVVKGSRAGRWGVMEDWP